MAFFRHTALGTIGTEQWSVSVYTSGSVSEAAANGTWVTAWGDLWTAITTLVGTNVTVSELFTSTMSATFRQTTKTQATSALAGTSSSVSLPYQNAVVATWRTAMSTKSGHGRWYLPTPATNALTATTGLVLSSTALGDYATGMTNLATALVTGGLSPVLVKKSANTTTSITNGDVSNTLATQRRRRSKIVPTRSAFTL